MAIAWFEILCHLEEYLRRKVSCRVEQGYSQDEVLPEPPVIKLYRFREPELDIWIRPKGSLIIAMDIWQDNADPNPKVANAALAELEEAVQAALKTWPKQAEADLRLRITGIDFADISGDGEGYRPQVAAFYKLQIRWAK